MYDGLGSVLGEVDRNGNVTTQRNLDVYGNKQTTTSLAGETPSGHQFVGFLGHHEDDNGGLIYMRARYYDAMTGRFVSEDAVRQGTTLVSGAMLPVLRATGSVSLLG